MKGSKALKKKGFFYNLYKYRTLTLMCIPAILFFFFFSYMPLPGIYVAFVNFNMKAGIFKSPFVGLKNFEFLTASGKLWELTRNTVLYNVVFIVLGNVCAIATAILLNEIHSKYFKKVSQTLMLLPHFISQVLVGLLVFSLLNSDTGMINGILTGMGREKWMPYADPNVWPFIIPLVNLWQNVGYDSIVYFAAICGIDAEMIEAAKVDGANGFQRIRYILLPSLRPTIVILLLFAVGGIIKGNFGLFYNIIGTNTTLYPTTDIIETFVYRSTMKDLNFSTASAVGLYQSIVGFAMVMIANFTVKKIDPDYSLF